MDIRIDRKPIYNANGNQIGIVATAIPPMVINRYQKFIIENQLKDMAYRSGETISVYHQEYPDTASIVVIGDINNLPSFPPFTINV